MRVLVTGIAGFVGGHLADFLRTQRPEVQVFGLLRPHGSPLELPARVFPVEADLEDSAAVEAAFDVVHPDRIIHLAAQSSVHRSWEDPAGTLRTNVLGLLNMLEAVRRRALAPRILVIGSAEEYGLVEPKEIPLAETAPLRPNSPYAVSKVSQSYLALQYALSHQMAIIRTRTFHHTGPGRGEIFAESSFARQIAEIELGRRPPLIEVGNLEAIRDFSDVRDVVRAYWALLDRGEPGEVYNVCSGRSLRIRDLLDRLIALAEVDVEIRVDGSRLRPADIPALVGDPRKLQQATGYAQKIELAETLADLLRYWRERLGAGRLVLPPVSR
ncbi:MAG TPA: GDP-mannose 4,6-dehydratase [Vicinamibacteria bacterium]|nr:GDP-mannose 4,6-dehydratase [Vicinamibacteria bacterium]